MKNELKKVAIVGGTSTLLLAALAAAGYTAFNASEPQNTRVLMIGPREEEFSLKDSLKKKRNAFPKIPPKSLGRKRLNASTTPKHSGYY